MRAGTAVPFIAAWSSEVVLQREVIYSGQGGIAYADEVCADRDEHGVLWASCSLAQGRGRPRFGSVHTDRQRVTMKHLLCQVCSRPADRDDRGMLWLLEDVRTDWAGWPEGLMTTDPPVCTPCARSAAKLCPHLLGKSVAVRVRRSDACAVYGRVWKASAFGRPVATPVKAVVPFDTAAARWVIAGQLVRSLHGCAIVNDLERGFALP